MLKISCELKPQQRGHSDEAERKRSEVWSCGKRLKVNKSRLHVGKTLPAPIWPKVAVLFR